MTLALTAPEQVLLELIGAVVIFAALFILVGNIGYLITTRKSVRYPAHEEISRPSPVFQFPDKWHPPAQEYVVKSKEPVR